MGLFLYLSMKTFIVQTSDSIDANAFANELRSMKAVERVDEIEKENWSMPGRPASDDELDAMGIEAEESGFVTIDKVKRTLHSLHNPKQ